MNQPLKTRKPTGKPSWPIVLLAGAEKTGKSYGAAKATGSDLIGGTWWVTIGEDQPDEYGQLGDFDIVEHDGTYRGILNTLRAIAHQPAPSTGVPLLVVDSMSRLWDTITGNAQDVANARAAKRGRNTADTDAQITMDLWNAAKDQWTAVMDAIRLFPGPVILTARLDQVAVVNDKGEPTKDRQSKVQAHKSLPFDVGAVIEMPSRGETWITGVRSVRLQLATRTAAPKDFTVDWFWRQLGLADVDTTPREHATEQPDEKPFDAEGVAASLDLYDDLEQLAGLWRELGGQRLSTPVDGRPLGDWIKDRKALLEERAKQPAMALAGGGEEPLYDDEVPF